MNADDYDSYIILGDWNTSFHKHTAQTVNLCDFIT